MEDTSYRAIAIVGVGAILPDAPNVPAFWQNVKNGRYSISDVTADRWDPNRYYDADPSAADKTYSKIGGWVREYTWDPMKWHLPIPPRVADAMDVAQQWAVACTREALEDYGYPKRGLDLDRTAVILGNAMAGEKHYLSSVRIFFPEYAHELAGTASFASLPEAMRRHIQSEFRDRIGQRFAPITEDTMPGELANCMAGRIANLYNFHGPNFVCDAACASAMAAISAAIEGLVQNHFDVAVTGGVDRNMGAPTFVKFCKIGALSATGTRPYAEGADGFVMGEGAALFLLKRLADAERDGDKIYAVLRGIGGSSDGKGKGITAPNPVGQKLAIERAWQNAGLSPATVSLIEGHGTSTRVGDIVEMQSMVDVLSSFQLQPASVALGSVKSNFGHLKGAAGAAGLLKTVLALHEKVLPPSLHCGHPNPGIDFAHSPLYVNTQLQPWTMPADQVRRAGLSAFGFGGTNFHAVIEEYIPHRLNGNGKRSVAVNETPLKMTEPAMIATSTSSTFSNSYKAPLRGALVIGAASEAALTERLRAVEREAKAGNASAPSAPAEADLRAPERLAIDYADAADLADKSAKALKALAANQPAIWKALRPQGIFRGSGAPGKVAFLYTGQGSQYVNMLEPLRAAEPIVAEIFSEADRIMTPLLGRPLSSFIFVDPSNPEAVAKAEEDLRQTEITQPTVLTIDLALTRLLAAYGIQPDMTMGHSLGEYGALVASGSLSFNDALNAVSARGRGMTQVAVKDTGRMAAVFAPLAEVERILKTINDYVVIANINSGQQSVIGGASKAVEQAMEIFLNAGYNVVPLPVSHAFHTSIVAPASQPLREMLSHLEMHSPRLPIVANVNGEFYPMGPGAVPQMLDLLAQQVACPVQFVKGLNTLYDAGARVFVEVGPKKALHGFAEEAFNGRSDVSSLFTNHPKVGDIPAFNQALCGLYAAGLGRGVVEASVEVITRPLAAVPAVAQRQVAAQIVPAAKAPHSGASNGNGNRYNELGHLFADFLDRGMKIYRGENAGNTPADAPVVITGAALGLPGTEHIFDDGNIGRLLHGEQFIHPIPARFREAMIEKHITRLVKDENGGKFETLNDVADAIKLAGRGGEFNLQAEFGISADRLAALDRVTQLAIGVGIDALRDAGIPLVMRYKTTTKGTQLPDRWGLPDNMRDDTGVIFGSAFPGYDSLVDIMSSYFTDRASREQLAVLESLRANITGTNGYSPVAKEIEDRLEALHTAIETKPYVFDRRFLLRVLSMGHSQFAELIGARGPNTQINSACATTAQAVGLAEDWIRAGRCRRVIVISADDVTSDHMLEWFGAGFLASGAAATDGVVEDAAIPFDRRRHGLLMGMGAAALVIESADAASERGIQPICEVLGTVTANSAFHGTRLDVQHIGNVMEKLMRQAETKGNFSRQEIAPHTIFVSHETYTPARGGSASAEVNALRHVFGDAASQIVIANTKGFTGHAMATGIEDVLAVKALETGLVPPVPNFKEIDPDLGPLNLSKGGAYPVQYAMHLGAGFGSQISMILLRWVPTKDGVHRSPDALGYAYRTVDQPAWDAWLSRVAGRPAAGLEVVNRTLRVRDGGPTARIANAVPETKALPAQIPPAKSPAVAVVAAKTAEVKRTPSPIPVIAAALEKPTEVKPAPAAAPAGDSVRERILALVVEKTGYPPEMLDLDLDLEADLGVDTVKQAELFAAIREIYNIPRDENRKLREYPTLSHVIRFVYENRPDLAVTKVPSPASTPQTTDQTKAVELPIAGVAAPASGSVKDRILALVVEKTGYPPDMLDLDLDLEADLGVDTVKQAELFAAIREIYSIPRDENRKLREYPTLSHVIRFVYENRPDLAGVVAATPPQEPTVEAKPVEAFLAKATSTQDDSVKDRILELVVEKTGYPPEMLDLDLDLEADLGVDTVKQAELFAAIREIYNIPRDENRKLREYPTLSHVIRFVYENRPDLAGVVAATPPQEPTVEAKPVVPFLAKVTPTQDDSVKDRILELVVEKTGYPPEMLDLDLDLEADLGVDTVKQAELFAAIREIYSIPRDENRKLREYPTLSHVIRFVYENRPDLAGVVAPVSSEPSALPAEPVPAQTTEDSIKQKVLQIAAEKTGYPQDMLDLDLDLEADLGVDTVKQAEMFAAIRAAYNIPRDENLKLRDFPTLAHVIQFARDRAAAVQPAATPVATPPAPAISAAPSAAPHRTPRSLAGFDAANAIPRRVPLPVLRPPLDLCKATGITLSRGQRVIVMPDQGGVVYALTELLHEKGVEVLCIEGAPDADALTQLLKGWMAAGPVDGVYWLPALDYEGDFGQMDRATWQEAVRVRIKSLYTAMRVLYEHIAKPGTFLISATRLGGQHGYDDAGALAPVGGAVTGFTKTYRRERIDALVKAIDFEAASKASEVAATLIAETLRDPGAVEIGYKAEVRWTIGLQELPAIDGQPGLMLDEKTVFLITGAAGSIVSAITADLAAASGGTFYLLDLVPEPAADDADLNRFVSDKEGLKRELFTRIQQRGERATPALVEKELASLERAQAARAAIDAVRAAGGTAHYCSVNLTDADAVARIIDHVRERSGRIDVLLHAAGIERSHALADKDAREFDLVFDVKSDGFFNLLHAIGDMPLGATVAFSSIAGRFGNPGQTDYSSANDLLCKLTSSFLGTRPATRGIAIDWTAWGGIGMATRGSIPKVMEMAGIDMLPPEAGVPLIRRELTTGGTRGEIVVGQRLGALMNEWDETGGLDTSTTEKRSHAQGPMLGRIAGMGIFEPLTVETTLDPKTQAFLFDHQIEGTPVLPGVMGVEAFAEAAACMVPRWRVEAVEDVNFLAPFKFYRNEPRIVKVETVISEAGAGLVADCRLTGSRALPNQTSPQVTTHFTGRVRLTQQPFLAETSSALLVPAGAVVERDDIYRLYFHGPAYQVMERAWWDGSRIVGLMAKGLPDNHSPATLPTRIAPRLIELCFQTAGVWEMGELGRMGLPQHIGRLSLFMCPSESAAGELYAIVTPRPDQVSFDAQVVDSKGNVYLQLTDYRTVAIPNGIDAERVKALRAAMSLHPVAALSSVMVGTEAL